MRRYYLLIAGLLCITSSCYKPKPLPACCGPVYGPGQVFVIFKPATSIDQAFALADNADLTILHATNFNYVSGWPADSLNAVNTLIKSRSYLDGASSGILINTNSNPVISIILSFHDLTPDNEQDWLSLIAHMKLQDVNDSSKSAILKVPAGQESYWVDSLVKNPIVKQASVVYLAF